MACGQVSELFAECRYMYISFNFIVGIGLLICVLTVALWYYHSTPCFHAAFVHAFAVLFFKLTPFPQNSALRH